MFTPSRRILLLSAMLLCASFASNTARAQTGRAGIGSASGVSPMTPPVFAALQTFAGGGLANSPASPLAGLKGVLSLEGSAPQLQVMGQLAAALPADFPAQVAQAQAAGTPEAMRAIEQTVAKSYAVAQNKAAEEFNARAWLALSGAPNAAALDRAAADFSAYAVYGRPLQSRMAQFDAAVRRIKAGRSAAEMAESFHESRNMQDPGASAASGGGSPRRARPSSWSLGRAGASPNAEAAAPSVARPLGAPSGPSSEFATRAELMVRMAALPAGSPERAELLYRNGNRALVLNSGANVTMHAGSLREGESMRERLAEINLALISRSNKGKPDGIGALGGMSNRTTLPRSRFDALSESEKAAILNEKDNEKDDIVEENGRLVLISDINRIRLRTVRREVREELGDLGIDPARLPLEAPAPTTPWIGVLTGLLGAALILAAVAALFLAPGLSVTGLAVAAFTGFFLLAGGAYASRRDPQARANIALLGLGDVRDDNYILNIWDKDAVPAEKVFADTPYNHTLRVEQSLIDQMTAAQRARPGGEASGLRSFPLFEALKAYGRPAAKNGARLEDGRDAERDYRYPHEWISSWAIASERLGRDPKALVELAYEVQSEVGSEYRVGFSKAVEKMNVSMTAIDDALGVPHGTAEQMSAAIDRAAKSRIPNTPEQLVTMFSRSESIDANVNSDIIKALAARGRVDEAEMKQRLRNFVAMYPAFESQRDANTALREVFEAENPTWAGPLARVQHEAWLRNEKLGPKFVQYTLPLHRFLQKAVAEGRVLNPGVPVTEGKKMTLDEFEGPKAKFRLRAEHFVFDGDADGSQKRAFVEAFGTAAGRPFQSGFEISMLAGEWDVLLPNSKNAGAITVGEKNAKAWSEKRAGFLAGLQQDNVASGLAALYNPEVRAKLAAAQTREQYLDALVDMVRIINVGWRLNNPWFGFDYKLQYRAFHPDPNVGIGMGEIIKDAVTFKATVEAILTGLDGLKMPEDVRASLSALKGNPAFAQALGDSVDEARLSAAITAQDNRPVALADDLGNLLDYLKYVFSSQGLIDQFMSGDILKVLEGRWDKVARSEVVRRLHNAIPMLQVMEQAQDANDAALVSLAHRIPDKVMLNIAKAGHQTWLEQETASVKSGKLVKYTPKLRDLLAKYAAEGALRSNGPLSATAVVHPRSAYRINARNFPDRGALSRFSSEFEAVTGEKFIDDSGNPLAVIHTLGASFDEILGMPPAADPGASRSEQRAARKYAESWTRVRREFLIERAGHGFAPVLAALSDRANLVRLEKAGDRELQDILFSIMRRMDMNSRIDNADRGFNHELIRRSYDLSPQGGVGPDVIRRDALLLESVLKTLAANSGAVRMPFALKRVLSNRLIGAAHSLTEQDRLVEVVNRNRQAIQFTTGAER